MAGPQHVAIGLREVDVGEDVAHAASGASMSFSSMFMWKVSTIIRRPGRSRLSHQGGHFGDGVVETDFAVIDRLEGQRDALVRGIAAHFLDGWRMRAVPAARSGSSPSRPWSEPKTMTDFHWAARSTNDRSRAIVRRRTPSSAVERQLWRL